MTMFKSKKPHASNISPLAPPPASTYPQQQQQQQQRQQSYPGQANGVMSQNNGARFAPATGGPNDLQRIGTNGTLDGSISSKSDKRRSGFFGFGGKKDKEKNKEKDERQNSQRSSFSVERPRGLQDPLGPDQQRRPEPAFIPPPHMSDRYPRPQPSPLSNQDSSFRQVSSRDQGLGIQPFQSGPQPIGQFQSGPQPMDRPNSGGGQRIASAPQSPPINDDFGVEAPPPVPKSQSMGFNQRQHSTSIVPETHPYRVNLTAQQDRERNAQAAQGGVGGIPRSASMPLDQRNGSSMTTPPPAERDPMRGSPSLEQIGSNGSAGAGGPQPWMKQFDPIVELIGIQPQKTYVASPPELEMILARTSAGGQPKQGQPGSATNDWDSVWLQLSGISLSMWSMKETRAAAAKGEKVPPTYFNITDSSLELLAPLPPPPHRPKSHPHHFVFSLNTAGSNRLLLSCPSEQDLARWSTGLRLAAWERARLEEIYTGHLIKAGGREPKSDLVKGRMEGWVRVRVMGGTDWKRLWVVLSTPNAPEDKEDEKKTRRRSFFGLGEKEKEIVQEPNTGVSMASFYLEPRTMKNKTSVAVLTITNVSQAYAVFPERLEVMSQSNLMKVVGRVGGEVVTIEGRLRDSGWALIMPETPETSGGTPSLSPLSNMMRWVTGFHDVFGLYGRPNRYNWDMKDPRSLFFAYPRGQDRGRLFLDIDDALVSDFRVANLPAMRRQFCSIAEKRMMGPDEQYRGEEENQTTPRPEGDFRLPPLKFNESSPAQSSPDNSQPRSLTPITERTDIDIASRNNSTRTASSGFYTTDRKASDGPHSKQGSGGSSKHMQGASGASGEERLAPISDSTETFGQLTEEPVAEPTPQATPTTIESETAPTTWSQSSGHTPTQGMTPSTTPGEKPQPMLPVMLPAVANGSTPKPPSSKASRALSPEQTEPPDLPVKASESNGRLSSQGAPVQPALAPVVEPKVLQQRSPPPQPSLLVTANGKPVVSPQPRHGSVDPITPSTVAALQEEPAAMYLMNMVDDQTTPTSPAPQPPAKVPALPQSVESRLSPGVTDQRKSPSPERPRIVTSFDHRPNTESLGRKPSGARAPPPKKGSSHSARNLDAISDEPAQPADAADAKAESEPPKAVLPSSATMPDLGEDAAHFVAFAEQPSPAKKPVSPPTVTSPPPQPEDEFRSSFAPSRAAAERRAKAEQATKEIQTARNVPGGGKRTAATTQVEWSGSEDDEDELEQEEEASPVVERRERSHAQRPVSSHSPGPIQRVVSQTRALPPVPRPGGEDVGPNREYRDSLYSQYPQPPPREYGSYSAGPERPRSRSPAAPPRPQTQIAPQPPAQRQTLWNANFSAEHGMEQNKSGKFVDLEEPNVQLTKAFAPHGLLQAGMQDKEERSAKKQEELARETGSSLINVPSKPPPPQTGLLGAVAAHERDRKNPGGIGATLTDREREKRLAEERQREIEKLQRQQMEHMSKYGNDGGMGSQPSPYGQFGYGVPPNMGMMGMPPMGYNPYQGGYNPYAQQQAMMAAQMAYHQAMMMSQAGSQAGGPVPGSPDRPASPAGLQGDNGPALSPGIPPYGNFFPQGYPYMGSMGMPPWSPSPPPPGVMPNMTGGSWLQPPGSMGGAMSDNGTPRSRVQSMVSDQGQGQGQNTAVN